MRWLFVAALAVATSGTSASGVWWVFLDRGPNRPLMAPVELQKLQQEHVENLGRLGELGKAPLAGPIGDDGVIRGIVVVRAGSRQELDECFGPDPFVQMGRLTLEAYPWSGRLDGLGHLKEPFELAEATLVIVKKGPHWVAAPSSALSSRHAAHLAHLESSGDLALSGALTGGGDKLEALLFRSPDTKKVEALLATDPAAKAGHFAFELHRQYVGAGLLDPAPPKSP